MGVYRCLVATGGRSGERCLHAVLGYVAGVSQKERGQGRLGVRGGKSTGGKLGGCHVVEANHQV